MTLDRAVDTQLARLRWAGLLVGVLAAAACGLGAYHQSAEFYPAWLIACLFWWGISLGSLAIAMIHHLTGGRWGLAIRRILESAYSLLPLVAICFAPLLADLPALYPWARPQEVSADAQLQYQSWYLNDRDFQIRTAVYFVVWTALAIILNALSTGEPSDEPLRRRRLTLISGPGLVVWGLTVTFASIDWAMSLEPKWFSTAYGALLASGQGIAALSLAIIVIVFFRKHPPWSALATDDCLNDLGNFLLAFVMFWAYIAFTQFLIIWSGNLPEEATWYFRRSSAGWQWIAAALAGFHFAVPFLLLLARRTKRQQRRLAFVAAMLLLMRIVDLHWLVMPAFHLSSQWRLHWLNIAALLAIGGFWIAAFAWRLAARAQLPVYELPLQSGGHP